MESLEQLRDRLNARFPDGGVVLQLNPGASAQHSLVLGNHPRAVEIALFLRDEAGLKFDYCSNCTGIDWPEREVTDVAKVEVEQPDGSRKVVEQKSKRLVPGRLEVVYHLFSVALRHGPLVIRLQTADRSACATVPSLTPVWRSCEFQEREVFDLFGITFLRHPDLRRILMWDEFKGHPMRKDYVAPDDFEWEPTPHDDVLARARAHYPKDSTVPGGAS